MENIENSESVIEIDHLWIEMSDGIQLSARIWMPRTAMEKPVPAVLEYIPYNKRDFRIESDEGLHPYFAQNGYAGIRVDIRGSGESQGVLKGEYLKQELDDAVEIIAWLAKQPWCDGAVGMMGISWGGFNALQVAALQPPALRAIITVASTDDRYADDIHYMGGMQLLHNPLWSFIMMMKLARPADPEHFGQGWKENWKGRLEALHPWVLDWWNHQRRDDFWRHGSVCEDISQIKIPVFSVAGWLDGYTNPVFRLLQHLQTPVKAQVGPWGHRYPHEGTPKPAIGFLKEAVGWWDQWLKGEELGMTQEPMTQEPALSAYMQTYQKPAPWFEKREGHWVSETSWPSSAIEDEALYLEDRTLECNPKEGPVQEIASPLSTGTGFTLWFNYGKPNSLTEPTDQREDDARSLCFDSEIITEDRAYLGAPILELEVASDTAQAMICARICDIAPDGSSLRTCYGMLNLCHRSGHDSPEAMEPGRFYKVRLQLGELGHVFGKGHRIRLALSNHYWPIAWPHADAGRLTIKPGSCRLIMPHRPSKIEEVPVNLEKEVEHCHWGTRKVIRNGHDERVTQETDRVSGKVELVRRSDTGRVRDVASGWEWGMQLETRQSIQDDDPLSCKLVNTARYEYGRQDQMDCVILGKQTVTCDAEYFYLSADIIVMDGEDVFFQKQWEEKVKRDFT